MLFLTKPLRALGHSLGASVLTVRLLVPWFHLLCYRPGTCQGSQHMKFSSEIHVDGWRRGNPTVSWWNGGNAGSEGLISDVWQFAFSQGEPCPTSCLDKNTTCAKWFFSWAVGQIQFTVASLHLTLARGERALNDSDCKRLATNSVLYLKH